MLQSQTKHQILSFVGILLLTLVIFGASSGTISAETAKTPSPLELHFNGTGPTTTEPFTVEGGWEVMWETNSNSFKLSAYGVTATGYSGAMTEQEQIVRSFEVYQPVVLANSSDSTGKALHRLGGTYYLKVIASGPWTIHLKTVKPTKDYLDVPYTGAP